MTYTYAALSQSARRRLLATVDAGVRVYVRALLEEGVETFESCEGGKGHAFPEPTVRFHGDNGAGFKAVSVALTLGLPVLSLRRSYSVSDGTLCGPVWEMTFREKARL
jgi:hypothetical protein